MKSVILAEDYLLFAISTKLIWDARIDRANSITKVFGKMQSELQNARVVGLIDDDSTVNAPYSKLFTDEITNGIHLIVRRSTRHPLHSVIVVKPASEGWLWEAANSVGVRASDYDLGKNFEEFKNNHTKGEANHRKPELARFLGGVARANPPMFTELQLWLSNELTRTP